MAPPWVFLHRMVHFVDGQFTVRAGKAKAAIRESGRRMASLQEAAAALEPSLVVADPPEETSLSMVRHLPKCLMPGRDGGWVSSTDKGLVVIYAGMYQPGSGALLETGCHMVYDAASNSVTAIPLLDPPQRPASPPTIKCLGTSAAILRLRHGDDDGACYVLAELVTSVDPGLPDADLYVWRSASSSTIGNPDGAAAQWARTTARLPLPDELCGPTYFFHIDMAFALGDSCVCWADLLAGVLICDLFAPEGPKFTFVQLPQECCLYTREETQLARTLPKEFRHRLAGILPQEFRQLAGISPEEFCSMGVVCGTIKFVAMVGYSEGLPKEEVVLKTWTLSPDVKEWNEGAAVPVPDLWESESFREKELPRGVPMNPLLSMNQDEVVYIFLNDTEYVDHVDRWKQIVGKDLVLNGHYAIRFDLPQNKVLYSKKSATNSLSLLMPMVLASDFSAYLHDGSKIRQRGEEASNVETSVKRTKH